MAEAFYEESVKSKDSSYNKRRRNMFLIVSVMFLAAGILFSVLTYLSLFADAGDEGQYITQSLIFSGLLAVTAILSFVMFAVFRRKKNNCNLEYDYTFISGSLRIAKVINNSRRKPVLAFDCSEIEALNSIQHEQYPRYETMAGIKKIVATPNLLEDDSKITFIFCKIGGTPHLILIEPSDVLIILIRRSSRKFVRS